MRAELSRITPGAANHRQVLQHAPALRPVLAWVVRRGRQVQRGERGQPAQLGDVNGVRGIHGGIDRACLGNYGGTCVQSA
jgi:hypothetical protein